VDVQWFLLRDQFSPYVVAAVGGMNTAYKMNGTVVSKSVASSVDTTSFIFESGVGATYAITDYLSLRSDVRYRLNTLPSNVGGNGVFNDLTVNFGVLVPFR
jgi:OOP family OmpA-OmpF porin